MFPFLGPGGEAVIPFPVFINVALITVTAHGVLTRSLRVLGCKPDGLPGTLCIKALEMVTATIVEKLVLRPREVE